MGATCLSLVPLCLFDADSEGSFGNNGPEWVPHWLAPSQFGMGPGKGPDVLMMQAALQIAEAMAEGSYSGGLVWDLRKAFDRVPLDLAMQLLLTRGCDPGVVRAPQAMLKAQKRRFGMADALGQPFTPATGLPQGDPLAMLVLNSLMCALIESLPPTVTVRAYADDLSMQTKADPAAELCYQPDLDPCVRHDQHDGQPGHSLVILSTFCDIAVASVAMLFDVARADCGHIKMFQLDIDKFFNCLDAQLSVCILQS
eukprot:2595172-Amphidinium_carterae.1